MTRIVALLLAGGRGRRLYPASRPSKPKQFLAPGDGPSLLRRTADRTGFADEVYAITPPEYADAVGGEVPEADILVEPEPKDTGPALIYATQLIHDQLGECVVVCLPTDHAVTGESAPTFKQAARVADVTRNLVTIGVEPDGPETGYGYIDPGTEILGGRARTVDSFIEKPDFATAERFVNSGHLWNAGVYAWTPDALVTAVQESVLADFLSRIDSDAPVEAFRAAPSVSIDDAVVEGTDDVVVVSATFEWDDIGSWDALGRVFGTDLATSSSRIDSEGTIVASDGPHISVLGAEDLVVAAYDDHVLVVPRSDAQRVREIAERVEK